jgi:hypothetical protein
MARQATQSLWRTIRAGKRQTMLKWALPNAVFCSVLSPQNSVLLFLSSVLCSLPSVCHSRSSILCPLFFVGRDLMPMGIDAMFMGVDVLMNVQFFIQQDLSVMHRIDRIGRFSQEVKIMRYD